MFSLIYHCFNREPSNVFINYKNTIQQNYTLHVSRSFNTEELIHVSRIINVILREPLYVFIYKNTIISFLIAIEHDLRKITIIHNIVYKQRKPTYMTWQYLKFKKSEYCSTLFFNNFISTSIASISFILIVCKIMLPFPLI